MTGFTGILLTLTVQCVSALYPRARRETGKATLLVYVVLMFALATIAIFMHLHWVQEFLIDNRNYPGGPMAYDAKFYANPINITGVVWYENTFHLPKIVLMSWQLLHHELDGRWSAGELCNPIPSAI